MNDNIDPTGERDQIIIAACRAATAIMERKGLHAADIANGMIAYGGSIALELLGPSAACEILQSKAEGLREQCCN